MNVVTQYKKGLSLRAASISFQSRCVHVHTRARGGLRLRRCGGGRGGGCCSRLTFGLPVEQALAHVTAFAHHRQQVVLEMLAAVGAVAEVDGDAAQRIDVIRQNIGLLARPLHR